ncbi:pectinesterase-like [Actinidia eriantha]|uniref:pectinesterase-like n=1 Tax=Actinidia eriantha TaxID=165200 RepID=UPI0025868B46|nr:pectinesterase-like [Actinidia eriantha]XP_057476184.1 pectinesterase-like [Actinidia eriantha]
MDIEPAQQPPQAQQVSLAGVLGWLYGHRIGSVKIFLITGLIIGTVLAFTTLHKHKPMTLCKANVTVSLDGASNFYTISAAVEAAPNLSSYQFCIWIKQGQYLENIIVGENKTNVVFLGDGIGKTIITGSRSCYDMNCEFTHEPTLWVVGEGFMAVDLTVENTAMPETNPAVALENWSDRSIFYRCAFVGYRGVVHANHYIQFYCECQVQGASSLIFGGAQAIFQSCFIIVDADGGVTQEHVISAQRRYSQNNPTGFAFQFCVISYRNDTVPVSYWGVPLAPFARIVFIRCQLGVIGTWSYGKFTPLTVFFAEYKNAEPFAMYDIMRPTVNTLDQTTVSQFTVREFFGSTDWIPSSIPYKSYLA